MNKTSILIQPDTRDGLKRLGKKAQTYDEIIRQLLELERNSQSSLYHLDVPKSDES